MSECSTWAAYPTVRRCPTHVFCGTLYNFFFVSTHHERFFFGCTNSHPGFPRWRLGKTLGIYPVGARDIAWDLSGTRSGYRLGFIRWPLGKSLGIFPVAAQEIPKHIRYRLRCIQARFYAFSIYNPRRFGHKKQSDGATCGPAYRPSFRRTPSSPALSSRRPTDRRTDRGRPSCGSAARTSPGW